MTSNPNSLREVEPAIFGFYCKQCKTKFSVIHNSVNDRKINCPFCLNVDLEELKY